MAITSWVLDSIEKFYKIWHGYFVILIHSYLVIHKNKQDDWKNIFYFEYTIHVHHYLTVIPKTKYAKNHFLIEKGIIKTWEVRVAIASAMKG